MKSKMWQKKALKLAAAATALCMTAGVQAGAVKAFAATDKTNIFRETVENEEVDEFKWTKSKADSTAIGVEQVGKNGFSAAEANNSVKVQYDDKISLAAGQYFEFETTLSNLSSSVFVSFKYAETKAAADADIATETGEIVSFKAGEGMYYIHSDVATKYNNGWSGTIDIPTDWGWMNFINGDSSLGFSSAKKDSASYKVRIYADGSAKYSIANGHEGNWFEMMSMGGAADTYFKAITEGYFQIIVQANGKNVFFDQLDIGVYNADGTAVENTAYQEDFDALDTASFKFVNGEAGVAASTKAILIDNAAADDYLVKKTALSAPENNYAKTVYDILIELSLPELSGSAKAVLYLGADSQTDLSAAAKLEFAVNEAGKVTVALAGGEPVETSVALNTGFALKIDCGGSGANEAYIGGVSVGTFDKALAGKYIALGTLGCGETDKAKLAVLSAEIYKYNYLQGTGGDFTETFDDNKFNSKNISVTSQTEEKVSELSIADGKLVTNNAGYTTIISTNETYGDFEFVFEISELTSPCNFNISWGRATGVSGYDNQGMGLFSKWGNDFNIMKSEAQSEVEYAEGYSAWAKPEAGLPTDKKDEDGKPLEKSSNFYDYNFSEGNLVFKVVKEDTTVSLYMYTADSAADAWGRLNPICKVVNDHTSGTVGLCSVPTGNNMNMKIDSFSIRNLDAHKAENLVVGGETDRIVLDLEENDDPIVDPLDSSGGNSGSSSSASSSSSGSQTAGGCKGGCGSVAGGLVAISAMGAALLALKKRKN